MIGDLTNHLWQSTIFAGAAAALTVVLRRNRAAIRHAIWVTASVKFLVPFSLLIGLGAYFVPAAATSQVQQTAGPAIAIAVDQIAQPFAGAFEYSESAPDGTTSAMTWIARLATFIWIVGFAVVVLARLRAWRVVAAAVRASAPVAIETHLGAIDVRSAPGLLEPGVVGLIRPVLLLPAGIRERLTAAQLDAVLAHELHHITRRDNLTAAFHMTVEALFWFHPVVWWIGARLVDERERACDEHVLSTLGEPHVYAASIVNVCKNYVESPLACVSGVTGANLKSRLDAILDSRTGRRLGVSRAVALAVVALTPLSAPIAAGMLTAPPRSAQLDPAKQIRKFDVASIKQCEPQSGPPGRSGGGGNGSFSPGHAFLNCFIVSNLVGMAHINNRESKSHDDPLEAWSFADMARQANGEPGRIRGGPAWVYTEKYTIEAKAEGLDPSQPARGTQSGDRNTMLGPMLRALLEDRFKLKVHTEVEQTPMWALTVAKSGLKLKPLPPEGDCIKWDPAKGSAPGMDEQILRAKRGEKRICGFGVMGGMVGPNNAVAMTSQTMDGIARLLATYTDRNVIDKTGITDKFNVYLEFAPSALANNPAFFNARETADNKGTPTAPEILTALQEQLGLKLEPTTGPRGYIQIDRIERPSPDLNAFAKVLAGKPVGASAVPRR